MARAHSYPQVYVDLGAIDWAEPQPQFDHYLGTLITYGLGDRILFGSDQMVWPEATAQAIARVRSAAYLTEAQKHAILFGNAARLFGRSDLQRCQTPST